MQNKGYFLNALPANGELTLLAVVTEKQLRPKRMGGSYPTSAWRIELVSWKQKSGNIPNRQQPNVSATR
jgi:hypothetical protein